MPQYVEVPGHGVVEFPDGMNDDQIASAIKANMSPQQAEPQEEGSFLGNVAQGVGNLAAGAVRGAGSIGATILAPFDMAKDALAGKGLSLESNRQRRADIDAGLQTMGAEPESMLYQGGKLAGEIAGTAGAGGVLGNAVRMGSQSPRALALANALQTGGMRAGTTPGAANMATRMAGGAATGATMAGMVDPEQAATGAVVGGALPPAMMAAGKVGQAAGRVISGPQVAEPVRRAVESAQASGYVIPPSQAKPTLANRLLEGMSGKIATAQNASAKNQQVTNKLIAKELGLPDGTPVSLDALKAIREQAGKAYEAVGSTGLVTTTPKYYAALDDIAASAKKAAQGFPNAKPNPLIAEIESLKTPQFDASSAIAKIKELRSSADSAYAAGDKELGKALKSASGVIEDAIETHLTATGAPKDLLSGFRNARQLIAKTYSVEKAMNTTSGNVDAVQLARQLAKGKPLSGGIKEAAEFAAMFPKAAQTVEKMGSLPQLSPLDWAGAATASGLTGNPAMMAGLVARPAARTVALSKALQAGLSKPAGNGQMAQLLRDPGFQQAIYRTAPVVATSR